MYRSFLKAYNKSAKKRLQRFTIRLYLCETTGAPAIPEGTSRNQPIFGSMSLSPLYPVLITSHRMQGLPLVSSLTSTNPGIVRHLRVSARTCSHSQHTYARGDRWAPSPDFSSFARQNQWYLLHFCTPWIILVVKRNPLVCVSRRTCSEVLFSSNYRRQSHPVLSCCFSRSPPPSPFQSLESEPPKFMKQAKQQGYPSHNPKPKL